MLGRSLEAAPQLGVLRGDAHGARVEVADAHHHAARRDQRGGGEGELVRPQERRDHHIAPGAQAAVGLEPDTVAQAAGHQGLLRLRQPELPGQPHVHERGERRGAGAALEPGHGDVVRPGLGHAQGHRAHARLRHELDADAGLGVDAAQVVDELGQVLDGVDVVVGRGRDQPHARRRVPQARDLGVDLVAGELAALARLGALGDLDLDDVGLDQVARRHPEAGRGHLPDGGVAPIAVLAGL